MFKSKSLTIFLLAALLTACPNPTPPPPTPLGLSATTTSSAGIQVSWVASLGASSYTLERRTDATAFVGIGGTITTTTYADSGLQGSTKYTYRVRAVGEGGASEPSLEAFATTQTDLVNLQATATSSAAVNLSWSAVPNATGYTLERKIGMGPYSTVTSPSGTSYTDSGLTANTPYTYRLTALQLASSVADEKSVTTAPNNPTVSTPTVSSSSVILTWTAPPEAGTYTYTVERKQGSGAYSLLGSPSALTFTDSSVTATSYTYRVKAVSNGAPSSGVEKTVTVPLGTPTGFTTSGLTKSRVTLSWTAVSGATSYLLSRKNNAGTFGSPTTVTGTTYTDTSLAPSNTYTYRLQATNGSATSPTVDSSPVTTTVVPYKVLFIGNSMTFVNDVPGMVKTLASDELREFTPTKIVVSGGTLDCHYNQGPSVECAASSARAQIAAGGWDAVVLQELSDQPVCQKSDFDTYVKKFDTDIKAVGAKTVIALNWVKQENLCPQFNYGNATLSANTYASADAISGAVAPIGAAWAALGAPNPTPKLYVGQDLPASGDTTHANVNGSYLTASVYYALFYKKSPVGLTATVKAMPAGVVDNPNAALSNVTIASSTVSTLQTAAWNAYQTMNSRYQLP